MNVGDKVQHSTTRRLPPFGGLVAGIFNGKKIKMVAGEVENLLNQNPAHPSGPIHMGIPRLMDDVIITSSCHY